jgi:hypothetical protein
VLRETKRRHEAKTKDSLGIPIPNKPHRLPRGSSKGKGVHPREYAFARVGELIDAYRSVLRPMLDDRSLSDECEIGFLISGDPVGTGGEPPWTTFVDADWLRWLVRGQESGFGFEGEIPPNLIHGRIPGWPDEFFEFLGGIVLSNSTFVWQRSPRGFLVLCQPRLRGTRRKKGGRRSGGTV